MREGRTTGSNPVFRSFPPGLRAPGVCVSSGTTARTYDFQSSCGVRRLRPAVDERPKGRPLPHEDWLGARMRGSELLLVEFRAASGVLAVIDAPKLIHLV